MKTTKIAVTTSLCANKTTHDFVRSEAARLNLSQREVLDRMAEAYKRSLAKKKDEVQELRSANEIFTEIDRKLDKAIKRDDVVVSFIKEHESKLGSPTLLKVQNCEKLLNQLVSILQNIR